MGTSKGYKMPSGGAWTPLKSNATRYVNDVADQGDDDGMDNGKASPQALIAQYINAMGGVAGLTGSSGASSGTGGSAGHTGAGGGSGSGGSTSARQAGGGRARSAIRVGRNIGNFFSGVSSVGLDRALHDMGLGELVGKSVSELKAGLLDALAGPASTIDDQAARAAWIELEKELLADAQTPADVEQVLLSNIDNIGLNGLLIHYFALYIYERFCRDFYERWVKAAGSDATAKGMKGVRSYIEATVGAKTAARDVADMAWKGSEGERLATQVLRDTCIVFGVPT